MGDNKFKLVKDECRSPGVTVCQDGVHFGYYAAAKERPSLLLYKKGTEEIAAEIVFPIPEPPGNFYSMKIKLPVDAYEYNFRDGDRIVTDPYARRIAGREVYGEIPSLCPHGLRGGFAASRYRWDGDQLPDIPFHDAVMYHLHVRGFTMNKNSGVSPKGTFAGLKKKIPYLLSLGINQVKLMPVYEFAEVEVPEYLMRSMDRANRPNEGTINARPADRQEAPYGNGNPPLTQQEAREHAFDLPATHIQMHDSLQMAEMEDGGAAMQLPSGGASELRRNFWGYGPGFYFAPKASYASSDRADIEFKDMVKAFHANGIEIILEFSFSEDTDIALICDCLTWWAEEYHVDGFSLVGRDGIAQELARLPLFATRKLICSWYPDSVCRENAKREHPYLLAESNDGFMNDGRRLLKGDSGALEAFSWRTRQNPVGCAQMNYMTNHDGFTMLDLVSYNMKYNDENGENGRDGSDANFSWNCGEEGPSAKRKIAKLRMRQRKNAYAMMLLSQGTPMLLAGDEFGNTQKGNNNPWCHDSDLTWLNWNHAKSSQELTEFVRKLIAYRKNHPVLHQRKELSCTDPLSTGFPDLSYHGERAWYADFHNSGLHMGCMYTGSYAGEEGFLYLAWNFHWEEQALALPLLPDGFSWFRVMDTSLPDSFLPADKQENLGDSRMLLVPPRTVAILEGRKDGAKH
ncbi:MAG: hypothetical protein LUI13_08140 [Lachnospiraceae bacterium]|nr:hypothetical protein [Lachnospiraceae bacterium]